VHLQKGLRMIGQIGVHAAEQTQLVGLFGQFGEQVGNPQAGLAVLTELPGRAEQAGKR